MGYLGRKLMLAGEESVKGKANLCKGKRSSFDAGNPCRFLQGQAFCSTFLLFSLSLQFKIVPRSVFIFPRALTSL